MKGQETQTKEWLNDPTGGYYFEGQGIGERIFLSIFVKYSVYHIPEFQGTVKLQTFLKMVMNIQVPYKQLCKKDCDV